MELVRFHDVFLLKGSLLPFFLAFNLFFLFLSLINLFQTGVFFSTVVISTSFCLVSLLYLILQWLFDYQREWSVGVYTFLEMANVKLGIFLFIVTEIMVFFSLFFSFFYFSFWALEGATVWPTGFMPILSSISLAFPLTLLLVASSGAVNVAVVSILLKDFLTFFNSLFIAIILGSSFLYLQIGEYRGLIFGYNDALSCTLFLSITGLHGLHVFFGLCLLGSCLIFSLFSWTILRASSIPSFHTFVEVSAWYWHFVDFVWLFVFSFLYEKHFLFSLSFLDFYKVFNFGIHLF